MTRTPATQTLAVVYQMGKVASTAIVEALNTLPAVTALQSHFLGNAALRDIVPTMTSPTTSDYFFHHQRGQLLRNLETTRSMQSIMAGHDPRHLVTLSMTRDPVDWARSSLLQDMDGYVDDLCALAPPDLVGLEARLEAGLVRALATLAEGMAAYRTPEGYLAGLRQPDSPPRRLTATWTQPQRHILTMLMRPINWFEAHYVVFLGHKVSEMAQDGPLRVLESGRIRHVVLRYEDLTDAFPRFCELAFGQVPNLRVRNGSGSKRFAAAVDRAFATPEAAALATALRRSDYARLHGYGETNPSLARV